MTKHTPAVIEPERGALTELEKDYIAEAEEQLERKMSRRREVRRLSDCQEAIVR